MKIILLFALTSFLLAIAGCTTTGDDPNIYWQQRMGNTPVLVTPFGEAPVSH
jgi:hypothetical protein